MDTPEDIYEDALAFQKTGRATHSDNQRLAAMAGYTNGAMRERARYNKKLNEIDNRLERIGRVIDMVLEAINNPQFH